jgi:hypothetical protein
MTLTGYGIHPTAGPMPAWKLRAGDWVRVGDLPADDPRRIIATSYDGETQTTSLTTAAKRSTRLSNGSALPPPHTTAENHSPLPQTLKP